MIAPKKEARFGGVVRGPDRESRLEVRESLSKFDGQDERGGVSFIWNSHFHELHAATEDAWFRDTRHPQEKTSRAACTPTARLILFATIALQPWSR